MPVHKSAEKRVRQTERRTAVNRARTSKMRTAVKKFEEALAAGDKDAAREALRLAESAMAKTAQKGLIKKTAAGRKTSRLVKKLKSIS